MKLSIHSLIIVLVFPFLLLSQELMPEPPNLGVLQKTVRHYVTSGAYDSALVVSYKQIKDYISSRLPLDQKVAVVMDIDETTLSNLEFELRYGFGYNGKIWHDWIMESNAKAIPAALDFFNWVKSKGIAVFFITGRRAVTGEIEDDPTAINLKKEGFIGYQKLYLKPREGKINTINYKSGTRKEIIEMGYLILANIGDQYSDLGGGYAEKQFKLPNPMYFVD